MSKEYVDALSLTEVYQKKHKNRINVYFTTNGTSFFLPMDKSRNPFFIPLGVFHVNDQACTLCGNVEYQGRSCSLFSYEDVDALFERLIDFPKIRLEWLFTHYEPMAIDI